MEEGKGLGWLRCEAVKAGFSSDGRGEGVGGRWIVLVFMVSLVV